MPDEKQQVRVSERVVKEAVGWGLDTPFRDSILEAVDEAEGGRRTGITRAPISGALFAIGAAFGYLLGLKSTESIGSDVSLESIDEPEVVEDLAEDVVESVGESVGESTDEAEERTGARRLPRLALLLAAIAGAAFVRRRMKSEEGEEWEPIEEFDTAIGGEEGGEEEQESEADADESMDEDQEGATESETTEESETEGDEESEE